MNRRNLLALGVVTMAQNLFSDQSCGREYRSIKELWLTTWMSRQKAASGTLHLSRFKDPMYFLTKPITWLPDPPYADTLPSVRVSPGFVTDLASVPRIFWSLLRPDGDYTFAAILHDFLYWTQSYPRETADEIFLLAMREFKISHWKVSAIHRAVRAWGHKPWSQNAELKRNGERRILRLYPDDPKITWTEWKLREGVFAD